MGSYLTDQLCNEVEGLGMPGYAEVMQVAAYLPLADFPAFDGASITAIRFGLVQPAMVNRVVVYASNEASQTNVLVGEGKLTSESPKGWTTVKLDTPYKLDYSAIDAVLIGIEYEQSEAWGHEIEGYYDAICYPLSFVNTGGTVYPSYVYGNFKDENGQYLGEAWYDLGMEFYGNQSVQAIVESENFPDKDIELQRVVMKSKYQHPGDEFAYAVTLKNFGTKKISNYTIDLSVDDILLGTYTSTKSLSAEKTVEIDGVLKLPKTLPLGRHSLIATLKTVDGEAPAGNLSNDTCSTPLLAYTTTVNRQKQLLEHFTSQTCTYCPLGIQLLEQLSSMRKDLAWVSVHGNMQPNMPDPYNFAACDSLQDMLYLAGWPSAGINRIYYSDLTEYPGEVLFNVSCPEENQYALSSQINEAVSNAIYASPSFVTLGIKAKYNVADHSISIVVNGQGVEGAAQILSGYGLTVYVTEDGLTSRQYELGAWVENFEHNNVLRDVLTPIVGAPIAWNGDKFEHNYFTRLEEDWNPTRMHVIAFVAPSPEDYYHADLLNMEVNNCEMVAVEAGDYDGIEHLTVKSSPTDNAIYDLSGRRHSRSLKPGIYVSNGRKLIVR